MTYSEHLPREIGKTNLTFYGTRFFTLWYSGNDTGGSFGVAWGERNVHLTVWFRGDIMNCHITDDDNRIWEKTMTLTELKAILAKTQEKCIGNWSAREKMIVLDPERLDAWKKNSTTQGRREDVDLGGYIRDILPVFLESGGIEARIGNIMKGSILFGLQYRRFKWHFVIAAPSGEMLRWPVDPTKGPLRRVPTIQGFRRYMKYLEKEGFFDHIAPSIGEETIQRLAREVELAVIQVTGEPNNPVDWPFLSSRSLPR